MIPLLLITVLLYGFSERIFRSNIEEEADRYLQEVSSDVDSLYGFYEQAVSLLSKDPLVLKIMDDQMVTEEETRAIYEKMYYLFSGRTTTMSLYLLVVPRHYNTKDYLSWGVLRKASISDNAIVFHPAGYSERIINDKALTAAQAIEEDDELKGFILVDIQREELSGIIHGKNQGNIWEVLIVNDIGNVLYSKNQRENEARPFKVDAGYDSSAQSGSYTTAIDEDSFHASYRASRNYPFRILLVP